LLKKIKKRINKKTLIIVIIILVLVAILIGVGISRCPKKCWQPGLPCIKLDAVCIEGLGLGSPSNYFPVLAAALSENKNTPVELYEGVPYFGGNSGGSWTCAQLVTYKNLKYNPKDFKGKDEEVNKYYKNELKLKGGDLIWNLDKIKSMTKLKASEFYSDYFMKPLGIHLDLESDDQLTEFDPTEIQKICDGLVDTFQNNEGDELSKIKDFFNLELVEDPTNSDEDDFTQINENALKDLISSYDGTETKLFGDIMKLICWIINNILLI
ncbi:unnamed protein product, partial [marine sediment metagenome]